MMLVLPDRPMRRNSFTSRSASQAAACLALAMPPKPLRWMLSRTIANTRWSGSTPMTLPSGQKRANRQVK